MVEGVASLPLSFPPSGTLAFYSINRPPWANISDPSVKSNKTPPILISTYFMTAPMKEKTRLTCVTPISKDSRNLF